SIRTTLAARHEARSEVLPLRLEDHPARDRDAGSHALPVSTPRRALRRRGQAVRQQAQGPRMSDNVAIRERPILFSGPMVRAILEGRKTQTRRVIVPQPWEDVGTLRVGVYHPEIVVRGEYEPGPEEFGAWSEDGEFAVRCRYGKPGDRLWVRESGWQPKEPNELELREGADTWPKYVYDADEPLGAC